MSVSVFGGHQHNRVQSTAHHERVESRFDELLRSEPLASIACLQPDEDSRENSPKVELSVASRLAGGAIPKKGRGHQHRRTAEMIQQLYTPNLSELPEDLEGKEPSGSIEESSEEESSDFSQDDDGQSPRKGKNDSSTSYETTNEEDFSERELERRNQDSYRQVGITGRIRRMLHSGGDLKMYFEEADPDKVRARITPEGVLVWKQKNFVDCLGQNVDIRAVDQIIEGK